MVQSTALLAPTPTTTTDEMAARTFLSRYSGATRETYWYALKKFFIWCRDQEIQPLQIKRPILELYVRWMEDTGIARSTLAHQLGVVRGFYRFAAIDEFIPKNPAEFVRVPRAFEDDTRLDGLNRFELGALLKAGKDSNPAEWALVVLMGMLGLRVSEACSIQVQDFQHYEGGHRVLKFNGKGRKPATIPLPIPVQRALDSAAANRSAGPLLCRQTGRCKGSPHIRSSVRPVIERLARNAGIDRHVHPHMLRHSFVGVALDAGVSLRDVQIAARHQSATTTAEYDRRKRRLDGHGVYPVAAFMDAVS
ncbi:MAG: tyrosine-type recombinase/integrase [Glutamicibacter arilaitensis]|uniref:tyrosine-type recombinase/integrase n=1 Tax=Glutamicibacter arilaitensis TaxID=256701 RepID=UPI003FB7E572